MQNSSLSFYFLLFIRLFVVANAQHNSAAIAKQIAQLNMTIEYWGSDPEPVFVNSVPQEGWTGDHPGIVPENDDSAEFNFEIFPYNDNPPTIENIAVSQAESAENYSVIIQPRVTLHYPINKPGREADDKAIYGSLTVDYLCYSEGSATVLVSIFFKYKALSSYIATFSWKKKCAPGPIPGLTIYEKGSNGRMIVQDGYVDAMYDAGSDLKAKEDKGTMNYFTVVREGEYQFVPIEWSYEVGNKNLSITLSGDATDDPVPDKASTVLEILYEGKNDITTTVTIIGTITVDEEVRSFSFSWKKTYSQGPVPGFDILSGSLHFSDNYAIVSDGVVQPLYLPDNSRKVVLSGSEACINLYIRGRFNSVNYTEINFQSDSTRLTIFKYGDAQRGGVGKRSELLSVCHECKASGRHNVIGTVTGIDNLISPITFAYEKECNVGKYLVDITPGMFVPHRSDYYAVKNGKTQPAYGFKNPTVKARWDEDKTRFYMTSINSFDIHQPTIYALAEQTVLDPTVSVIGHDVTENIIHVDADGPSIVLEVTYSCIQKGEFQVIMEIKSDGGEEGNIVFSWIKVCRPHSFSFSVGTSLDSMLAMINGDNVDPSILSLAKNVIEDGEVKPEYSNEKPSAAVTRQELESRFYIASRENSTLLLHRPPTVVVQNHKILDAQLLGDADVKNGVSLTTNPKEIIVNYKCKKSGISKVDINLFIGPSGLQYIPITFSVMKNCRDPTHWNIRLLKDVVLCVAIVVILLLLFPYIKSYGRKCCKFPAKKHVLDKDV